MMATQSLVDDSGFAGSSPQPGSSHTSPSTSPSSPSTSPSSPRTSPSSPRTSPPSPRTKVTPRSDEEPHCAVERAMERLQVKMAAFSLERRIVMSASREQWKTNKDSMSSWAAGILGERVRGLDEKLEACRDELQALSVARNLLVDKDKNEGLLGAEPDSLTMTSGDVGSRGHSATPTSRNGAALDAAVLLHLERRAHRDTRRQLRELKKRHEVLKDEVDRLRETSKIIKHPEEPKDSAREICRLQAALLQLERVRDELTSQNRTLKTQVAELAASTQILDTPPPFYTDEAHTENNRLRRKSTYKVVHKTTAEPSPVVHSLSEQELALAQCRLAATERALANKEIEARNELAKLSAENARLQEDCNRERVARKRCHSQLQSLKGKVRVFCRVRPPSDRLLPGDEMVVAASDPYTLSVFAKPGSPASLRGNHTPTPITSRDFNFDRVFDPSATQEQIFEETSDLLGSVMDGYNVCICAYGQTGTGKTHTILGGPDSPGLAPRVFCRIFEMANEAEARCDVTVSAYVLELYNDRLVDLLRPPDPGNRDVMVERLEIRRDREGVVWVQGASVVPVENAEQLQILFQRALSVRRTASTRLNASSSRSHLLIGVRVQTSNRLTGSVLRGKVSLLDLAGSERVSRSGAVDEQLREASSINKSLAALGDVISALATEQHFVPYRNSKLTMLLQDSLGGNAKTLMFVTVSPDACDLEETITSLTYATRVRQITNTAKRMAESREIARLKQLIDRLRRGERVDPESPDTSRSDSS